MFLPPVFATVLNQLYGMYLATPEEGGGVVVGQRTTEQEVLGSILSSIKN